MYSVSSFWTRQAGKSNKHSHVFTMTMLSAVCSGVPDCAHASPLPRRQQHDHTTPLLRWNLPVLGLVPGQSQRKDAERPFGLHGHLSAVCEYCVTRHFQLFVIRFRISEDHLHFWLLSRRRRGCVWRTPWRRGSFLLARKASLQSAWTISSWVECHVSGLPIPPHWLL